MILTVEEAKGLIPALTDSDDLIAAKLNGIEQAIKGTTNNDFKRFENEAGEIQWPADIKLGVLNLLQWDLDYRDKVGLASETISRHSVTFAGTTDAETEAGYPKALMKFLDPYRRARF